MSVNKVKGGIRTNVRGAIVNSNGVLLTEVERQALPAAIKKSLGIKPKRKPKPKVDEGIPF